MPPHRPSALAGAVPKATHPHWCVSAPGSHQHEHLTHLVPAPGMGHLKYESSSSQGKSFPKINYFTLDFTLKMVIITVLSVWATVRTGECIAHVALQEHYKAEFWFIRKIMQKEKKTGGYRNDSY